ncbi:MAG: polysaccharide deacetylase family protein [Pseudomonadota bacterium]
MSAIQRIKDAWRKNSPELLGLVNGGLPTFVSRARVDRSSPAVPVFSYHVVSAELLRADFEFLRRNGYRALTLDEVAARATGEAPIGEREVALTFDDGPRNFFDVAFPLVLEHGVHVTAFIAPGLHADQFEDFQESAYRPMTWGEIVQLHASGLVSIQSHTLQSQYVPRWPAAAELAGVDPRIEARLRQPPLGLAADFRAAKQLIEARCPGTSVRHLCFPMYQGNAAAIEAAAASGYTACYWGLLPGSPDVTRGTAPMHIPRLAGEFLRRLPGEGRLSLRQLLRNRLDAIAASRARGRQA